MVAKPVQTRPDQTIVRNSSLELLRIIAMIVIVAHHFAYGENFNFPTDSITLNRLWIQLINMGGKLGVNLFVLISGYFLIKSDGIKTRKLVGMWLAMLFYSLAAYTASVISGAELLSPVRALYAFMPLTKSGWWFMEVYFMLYLLHPCLNITLRNLNKSQYEKMLLMLGVCWSVVPTLTNSYLASSGLLWFMYLYSISGYIRLWADDFGSKNFIWLSVIMILLNFVLVIIFDVVGFKVRMFAEHPLHLYNMQMLPMLVIPVCMFIGFKHLNISHSRIINLIASATLGVYLLHENRIIKPFLWREIFRTSNFQDSPYLIPYSIAATFIVYISCTIIELLRSAIFRALSRGRLLY